MLKFWTPFLTIVLFGLAPYSIQILDGSIGSPFWKMYKDLNLMAYPTNYFYISGGEYHDVFKVDDEVYNIIDIDLIWGDLKGSDLVTLFMVLVVILVVAHLNAGLDNIMCDYVDNHLTYALGYVCASLFFWFVGLEIITFLGAYGFNFNMDNDQLFFSQPYNLIFTGWWSF